MGNLSAPKTVGDKYKLSAGVVPPIDVPAILITSVNAYPTPPLTILIFDISPREFLLILNTAPVPFPPINVIYKMFC